MAMLCRLRAKLAQIGSHEEWLGVSPGYADLTLKLKDVDPTTAPELDLNMSSNVRPRVCTTLQLSTAKMAHLKVKVCGSFTI